MWKKGLICLLLSLLGNVGFTETTLIVSFATNHLNNVSEAVSGVVVTPSGSEIETGAMSPFEHANVVITNPEAGEYTAFYVVEAKGAFRTCPVVGGIVATLTNQPEIPISFTPIASRIQTFKQGKPIGIGSISQPVAHFTLNASDLD
ncbi:MAG: hypothetical protein S4CHLAM102_02680 [Chlamydiia bacterium]|nr:hypothetical protein [Chlamydiia bacterium]